MTEDAEEDVASAFRPGRRPAWIAITLNGMLLFSMLGVPYIRGRWRAQSAGEGFAQLAQCLYGGRPVEDPGLALPQGDREHFAARVARAEPGWPGECVEILATMRPDQAIFLFPTPKQAEEDLRRALDQAEGELVALHRARERGLDEGGIGSVPERPLLAITQLRGALANVMEASDIALDPTQPAITLEDDATIVAPSRVPLATAAGGALVVRPEPGGLRVLASDGRGVAEVVAHDGNVVQVQVRRPPAVRGVAMGAEGGYLLWITSESTCSTDPAHCATRLLGVWPLAPDVREPSPRWWLAAHPAGRIDRAVRFEPGGASVIAVGLEGGVEVRSFALDPAVSAPIEGAELTPIAATGVHALGTVLDALPLTADAAIWADRDGDDVMLRGTGLDRDRSGEAHGDTLGSEGVRVPVLGTESAAEVRFPRSGEVALSRCGGWTALAMPHGIAVVAPGRTLLPTIEQPLRQPVLGASPADDASRLVCTEQGADVIAIDRAHRVLRWACTSEGCGAAQVVTRGASQVDAAHAGGTTLVAWTGDATHPQVRVARVRGAMIGAPEVPGPCWDAGQGMCGSPVVVAEGERLLVGARENGDLLVLELADDGFRRLPGL